MSTEYYLCVGVTVLLAFVLPLAAAVGLVLTRTARLKTILIGAAVFTVFQLLTRVPLLSAVQAQFPQWVPTGKNTLHYYLYILVLSLSAGLFEELGRYLAFARILVKERRWQDGMGFGIGHGGIEAIMLAGFPAVYGLFTFGLAPGQPVWYAVAGGVERLFAMVLHLGFTLLVLHGVRERKFSFVLLAIAVHAAVDFLSVLASGYLGVIETELVIGLMAAGMLIWIVKSRKRFERITNYKEIINWKET